MQVEIHFYGKNQIAFLTHADSSESTPESEISFFAWFALRQFHNLGQNPAAAAFAGLLCWSDVVGEMLKTSPKIPAAADLFLWAQLAKSEENMGASGQSANRSNSILGRLDSDFLSSIPQIINPPARAGDKCFIATLPPGLLDAKGFGLLGQDLNYFTCHSILAMFRLLARKYANDVIHLKLLSIVAYGCASAHLRKLISTWNQIETATQLVASGTELLQGSEVSQSGNGSQGTNVGLTAPRQNLPSLTPMMEKHQEPLDLEESPAKLIQELDEKSAFPVSHLPPALIGEWTKYYLLGTALSQEQRKELQRYCGKWQDTKIPNAMQEKCIRLVEPFLCYLFALQGQFADRAPSRLSTKDYEELGAFTGSLLATLCQSSFLVGWENCRNLATNEGSRLIINLLEVICEPTYQFASEFIRLSTISDKESEASILRAGRVIRLLGINCCTLGVEWASSGAQSAESSTLSVPQNVTAQRQNEKIYARQCQSCGIIGLTKYVDFYQNIGVVILRFGKQIKGEICMRCIHRYFWQYTIITLMLGWWGVISCIVTPFIIANNAIRYFAALILPSVQTSPRYTFSNRVVDFLIVSFVGIIGWGALVIIDFLLRANTYYLKSPAVAISGLILSSLICLGSWFLIAVLMAFIIKR